MSNNNSKNNNALQQSVAGEIAPEKLQTKVNAIIFAVQNVVTTGWAVRSKQILAAANNVFDMLLCKEKHLQQNKAQAALWGNIINCMHKWTEEEIKRQEVIPADVALSFNTESSSAWLELIAKIKEKRARLTAMYNADNRSNNISSLVSKQSVPVEKQAYAIAKNKSSKKKTAAKRKTLSELF